MVKGICSSACLAQAASYSLHNFEMVVPERLLPQLLLVEGGIGS
jgi:hypothetical protein